MLRTRVMATVAVALVAGALVVPMVSADTCCANTKVRLQPRSVEAGDVVRASDLRCLAADNGATVDEAPLRFWLWPGRRAGEDQPDTTPGEGFPADIPDTEAWPAFDSVTQAPGSTYVATLTVPELPARSYQLWWWCEGGGPGGGIHYSTGTRLAVGLPDTASSGSPRDQTPLTQRRRVGLLLVAALLGLGTAMAVAARPRGARTREPAHLRRPSD